MGLLRRLDAYLDAVPRPSTTAYEVGPLTVFVSHSGWPYYARPRIGRTDRIRTGDVVAARQTQRQLGVPEAFEWVAQTAPELAGAAVEADLSVVEHSLLVHDPEAVVDWPRLPDGVRVRLLSPDDGALASALAVAEVAFANGGTATGAAGVADRATAAENPERVERTRERLRRGLAVMAVAEGVDGPLAIATHQPVDDVTEVVGVATLPIARRQGLGAAVTAALVADAYGRGATTVMLSAADDDVARVYERIGFARVGSVGAAERSGGSVHRADDGLERSTHDVGVDGDAPQHPVAHRALDIGSGPGIPARGQRVL